jgi:2'-5' RNA ligase
MRLFFALLPDADTRNRLLISAAGLQLSDGAILLAVENYHVTLAFIGEVRDSETTAYRRLGAASGIPHCAIALDACEYWPPSQAVVLAARENPPTLVPLVNGLRTQISLSMGRRDAERSWRAHATLARKVAQAPVHAAMSPVLWNSRAFALMHSATAGADAVYTVVDSWPLLDKP